MYGPSAGSRCSIKNAGNSAAQSKQGDSEARKGARKEGAGDVEGKQRLEDNAREDFTLERTAWILYISRLRIGFE